MRMVIFPYCFVLFFITTNCETHKPDYSQEKFIYDVKYGIMKAGKLEITLKKTNNGFHIFCREYSNKVFSLFFKIDDEYEVITDENFLPIFYRDKIQEGRYRRQARVHFRNGFAIYGKDSIRITPFTRDIFSAIFYLRRIGIKDKDTVIIHLHTYRENHVLKLSVSRIKEGKNSFLLVEPTVKNIPIFGKSGDLKIYFDKNYIPVKLKTKLAFGYITATLKEYKKVN